MCSRNILDDVNALPLVKALSRGAKVAQSKLLKRPSAASQRRLVERTVGSRTPLRHKMGKCIRLMMF